VNEQRAVMSNEEERLLLIEALRNPLRDLTMGQHGPGSADETVADALLPVVERIAKVRAAENLRAAADDYRSSWQTQARLHDLADDLARHTVEPETERAQGFIQGLDTAAAIIRRAAEEGAQR
jgi:hypothetical protein